MFPRRVDGDRYVGEVVELLDEQSFAAVDGERCGVVQKQETPVYWNTVARRTPDGEFRFAYKHPELGDDSRELGVRTIERIANRTDRRVEAVEREFHRKHRYVRHMVREGIDDFDSMFDLLADLETNEAATVERLTRTDRGATRADGGE